METGTGVWSVCVDCYAYSEELEWAAEQIWECPGCYEAFYPNKQTLYRKPTHNIIETKTAKKS